jgi:UDP-2,4-diacetamido-2,4,6-trideoxy-beta-L-altropyranose hydrolase
MMGLAVFRCDASPTLGAGHVLRCLALAEEFIAAGRQVVFAVRAETLKTVPALGDTVRTLKLVGSVECEATELAGVFPNGADILVIDHYQLNEEFESSCRGLARTVVVLDDRSGRRHDCHVLIDAGAADPSAYGSLVPRTARILAGPKHALLRRAFVARRMAALARRDGRPVENILVSFGATDPRNATAVALEALGNVDHNAKITVALSSQAPHLQDVEHRFGMRIRLILDPSDMAELICEADLAIGAAGVSAYERACLGLPSILVTLADNQRGIADLLVVTGAAIGAGALDPGLGKRIGAHLQNVSRDAQARIRMARAASIFVDGAGAHRVAKAVMELAA